MSVATNARVLHVALDVLDIERALAFYRLIGLPESRRSSHAEAEHIFLGSAEAELQLSMRHGEPVTGEPKPGHVALGVDDMTGVLARLEEAGFPPGVMPQDLGTRLTAKEYVDVVAFLLTLK